MKKKSVALKTLWERAAKAQKVASSSTPTPITIESAAANQSSPHDVSEMQPEIASTEPEI